MPGTVCLSLGLVVFCLLLGFVWFFLLLLLKVAKKRKPEKQLRLLLGHSKSTIRVEEVMQWPKKDILDCVSYMERPLCPCVSAVSWILYKPYPPEILADLWTFLGKGGHSVPISTALFSGDGKCLHRLKYISSQLFQDVTTGLLYLNKRSLNGRRREVGRLQPGLWKILFQHCLFFWDSHLKTSSENSAFNSMQRTLLAIGAHWPPAPEYCTLENRFPRTCGDFYRLPFAEVSGDCVTDAAYPLLISWPTRQRSLHWKHLYQTIYGHLWSLIVGFSLDFSTIFYLREEKFYLREEIFYLREETFYLREDKFYLREEIFYLREEIFYLREDELPGVEIPKSNQLPNSISLSDQSELNLKS